MTLLMGIDPIVSLRDHSDIDRDRIPDVLAWVARELVGAALREAQTNRELDETRGHHVHPRPRVVRRSP